MIGIIKELCEYRSMIHNLVKRDLRGRYKGSMLGFLWNLILPMMQIIVYIMVFTVIFRQNIEHYYAYLIVGMVPWIMFSDSLSAGAGSVVDNSPLITKIYFPRSVIPVSIVLSKLVNFFISMAIVIFVLSLQHGFDLTALCGLPLAIICLLTFTIGLSLILAAANVYMRDVQYLTTVLLMMWIWITPIMYITTGIDNTFVQTILAINPVTYLIELFQDALYWKILPTGETIIIAVLESAIMFILGSWIYEKLSADFAEVL